MGWVLGILIGIIIILLLKIIRDLKRLHDAGAYDGPSAATLQAIASFQAALAIVQRIRDEDRSPTEAECLQLKQLWEEAQAGDLSALSLRPLKTAIEELCPSS
ncbi:MAG: hypothetical protein R2730_14700 [Chitinophagales bacterium]